MSFANPTPLRIGMSGTLGGRRFRVAGRVVMGMEEGGETYYWNEFNLVDERGDDSVTLVFEETESGGEWKLFTLFDPGTPLTAADAASRRVGDRVNLDGTPRRITLVDESRVYHIEGIAPEGVEVGDVAHYFNAETGDKMLVASWTGNEIEFYWGADLPRGTVAQAFGVSETPVRRSFAASGAASDWADGRSYDSMSQFVQKAVGVVLVVAVACAILSFCTPRRASIAKKVSAPPAPLEVARFGMVNGTRWQIRRHGVMEIAQVGRIYERHEYVLEDDAGGRVLVVCGLQPGEADWVWFTPLAPDAPLTPAQAAALRVGDEVNVDGWVGRVTQLHQATVRQANQLGNTPLRMGAIEWAFEARSGATPLLARWDAEGIVFYRGERRPAQALAAAFMPKPAT